MLESKTQPSRTLNYIEKLALLFAALCIIPNLAGFIFLYFINEENTSAIYKIVLLVKSAIWVNMAIILILSVTWHVYDVQKRKLKQNSFNVSYWQGGLVLCRYFLASMVLLYAIGKLMGLQLQSSIVWNGDELGNLSGYQLTWAFFGYSKIYHSFIAYSQLIASLLLLFRRTALLGAFLLLPILVNIVIIDYAFQIFGPLPLASMMLYMCCFLVVSLGKPVFRLLLGTTSTENFSFTNNPRYSIWLRSIIFILILAYSVGLNLHRTTRQESYSILDGSWYSTSAFDYSDSANSYRNYSKLFIDHKYASVQQPYNKGYYTISYKKYGNPGIVVLTPYEDTTLVNIEANYQIINSDSLIFTGKQGNNIIRWILKKKL